MFTLMYFMLPYVTGLFRVSFCLTYLDNILICSSSWMQHLHHLEVVFKCLKEADLKLKLSKHQFFENHLHYLGHVISKQGIQPLPQKVSAIQHMKEPINVEELWHFLDLTGCYGKFVSLFTNITKPLNKLLKKDTKFQWSKQCQAAFNHLKQALCRKSIL